MVFRDSAGAEKIVTFKERPLGFSLKPQVLPVTVRGLNDDSGPLVQGLEGLEVVRFNNINVKEKFQDYDSFVLCLQQSLRRLPRKIAADRTRSSNTSKL
jgi:formyltetrahydrofolate synthetase